MDEILLMNHGKAGGLSEKHKVTESEEAQPILDDLINYYNDCRMHQETEEIPSKR